MNQEFISNVLILLMAFYISILALGAMQIVINLIRAWRGQYWWQRYWN